MSDKNMVMSPRYQGKVAWFNAQEEYGFLQHELEDGTSVDVFFHKNEFKKEAPIGQNQLVEYDLFITTKGPRATNCIIRNMIPEEDVARALTMLRDRAQDRKTKPDSVK